MWPMEATVVWRVGEWTNEASGDLVDIWGVSLPIRLASPALARGEMVAPKLLILKEAVNGGS